MIDMGICLGLTYGLDSIVRGGLSMRDSRAVNPLHIPNGVLLTVHISFESSKSSLTIRLGNTDGLDLHREVWAERPLFREAKYHGRPIFDYCNVLLADIRAFRGVRLPSVRFFFEARFITRWLIGRLQEEVRLVSGIAQHSSLI